MADGLQTYPFEFRGGLISNLSPLQQGTQAPGSARLLKNFEPSTDGGYRRIEGYSKYSSSFVPSYGEPKVQGSGQTGTTLIIANIYTTPSDGDTFTIAGIEKVYTVLAVPTVTTGAAALSIYPSLASSPADNAALTMLSCDRSGGGKLRFTKYRVAGVDKVAGVDGVNVPFIWNGTTFSEMISAPSDVIGASFIAYHKNQMLFAKGETLVFTSPYTDTDFNAANGSGVISVGGAITGIIPFREALIIFTDKTIQQLVGNTLEDFVLQPVTNKVGCVAPDTIQEIGGDVIFLGPEGLRLFSATDRVGDFNLGVVSKTIQSEMTSLISASTSFASCIIKQKSQYRIFGYLSSTSAVSSSKGVLGTQMVGDNTSNMSWAETIGIKAYAIDSDYENQTETIVFANDDGYVYQMEKGNSFDGSNIVASFATPFVSINDPRLRKTFYKLFLYTDPQGSVTTSVNLKLDFDTLNSIQPDTIQLSNEQDGNGGIGFYGSSSAKYGSIVYGSKLMKQFETQVVGSAFSVSLQFISDGQNPPFSLDAATLEYATHDRR